MPIENLTATERLLVGRCLFEAVDGPYFPDWEFATLVGAHKSEIRVIASDWSSGQPISGEALQLIGSVLNNLIGYPHDHTADLERATGATVGNVEDVFCKLRA